MQFVLPALSGPNLYLINRHYLTLSVRMVNKDGSRIKNIGGTGEHDGTLPKIAPVNNIMHSLFEQVSCKFNRKDINVASKYYPWKSYLTNLLSYDGEAKASWMTEFGW